MMANKEFLILPAATTIYLAIAAIILVAIVPLIFGAVCLFRKPGRLIMPKIIFLVVAIVVLFICVMFIYFGYSAGRTKFIVSDEGLEVKGCLYGRAVPRDSIDKEQIKIVNMLMEENYRPTVRTNGVGLPGYLSGWFRLKDGDKALLFVTKKTDVVYVPTSKGYCVLLSPSEPAEFLNVTRQLWTN
jgi:hypothetical protein